MKRKVLRLPKKRRPDARSKPSGVAASRGKLPKPGRGKVRPATSRRGDGKRPGANGTGEAECDALSRRRRLERRAVDQARQRLKARAGQPVIAITRLIQEVLRADCERWHLSARGAAAVSRLAHPTTASLLKAKGKGYCDSLDKLVVAIAPDPVALLKRVILKIEAVRNPRG